MIVYDSDATWCYILVNTHIEGVIVGHSHTLEHKNTQIVKVRLRNTPIDDCVRRVQSNTSAAQGLSMGEQVSLTNVNKCRTTSKRAQWIRLEISCSTIR